MGLLENLDRSWEIEKTAERQRQEAYDENDAHVQATKQVCVESMKNLSTEIKELNKRLVDQADHLAMQEDNYANGDKNMADQKAECITLKDTYQKKKSQFEEQIRVLK